MFPRSAARLRSGAAIPVDAVRSHADGQARHPGTLDTIDNEVDTTTGTFRSGRSFPTTTRACSPTSSSNVRMLLDIDEGATVIPTSAIERGQQGTYRLPGQARQHGHRPAR